VALAVKIDYLGTGWRTSFRLANLYFSASPDQHINVDCGGFIAGNDPRQGTRQQAG
jgi:hypothetical protein